MTPKPQANMTIDVKITEIILELLFDNPRKTYGDSFDLLVQRNFNKPTIVRTRKAITQAMLDAAPKRMKGCPSHDVPLSNCSSGGCLSAGYFNKAVDQMESAFKLIGGSDE